MISFATIKKKIIRKLKKYSIKYIGDKTDLLVIDNFFPNPLSVFRYVEFDTYIHNFRTLVFTTGSTLSCVGEKRNIEFFINQYPNKDKVKVLNIERKIRAKLSIIVFLDNVFYLLPYLEKNKVPFIFTLYPGGGFVMNNNECDLKLKRIFDSPYFKKVIVTQNITKNYLIEKSFCKKNEIEFIYGVPCDWENNKDKYKRQIKEKETFDICFVAAKYIKEGKDKGYDVFIEVIRKLSLLSDNFKFHVVGGFTKNEIEVSDLRDKLKFYGYLSIDELRNFYMEQDIILSPNRANVLSKGAFDGFPTASVVEAGLCGVVMFVTDELNQNTMYTNDKDCVLISHNVEDIVSKVMKLFLNKDKLNQISHEGITILQKKFSNKSQMKPRMKLISKYLNKEF